MISSTDFPNPSSGAGNSEYDIAAPRPDSLIESLRAVGYDVPTAIADVIDNSVSALSNNIWLTFEWNGANSHIAILDDGAGMSEQQLVAAMRLGSQNPLELRAATDLGRFGLGLKTASFSQCRILTVATKQQGGDISIRQWNLDYITQHVEWRLFKQGSAQLNGYIERLHTLKSGTIVLWEEMDRIVNGLDVDNSSHHSLFLDMVALVQEHVSVVFHRYLEGLKSICMFVNNEKVKAWDPFLSREAATQILADESLQLLGRRIHVTAYVLPHHSKIDSNRYEAAAGMRGWLGHQGFYIYRNKRLLVAGDWLGLGFQREEHYKLARIAVDIPNDMDSEWHIDVKKSRAWPPHSLKRDLKRIAKLTRQSASEIYKHRGARLSSNKNPITFLWEKHVAHGVVGYRINREHPIVAKLIADAGFLRTDIDRTLKLIEQTIPVPTIVIEHSQAPDKLASPYQGSAPELKSLLNMMYTSIRSSGSSHRDCITRLLNMEPFSSYPDVVLMLSETKGDNE